MPAIKAEIERDLRVQVRNATVNATPSLILRVNGFSFGTADRVTAAKDDCATTSTYTGGRAKSARLTGNVAVVATLDIPGNPRITLRFNLPIANQAQQAVWSIRNNRLELTPQPRPLLVQGGFRIPQLNNRLIWISFGVTLPGSSPSSVALPLVNVRC